MINRIKNVIQSYLENNEESNCKRFNMEIPQNPDHGNLSTNVVMIYGKNQKNEMATELIHILKKIPNVNKVEYIHPGFLNIFLNFNCLEELRNSYNKLKEKKNELISIEYASPNPTGPCHIGHARGSIIGDTLVSVFEYLGYEVRKDCIFNDGGKQVEKFIESIYIRYKELNNICSSEEIDNIFYKGDYIKDLAIEISNKDKILSLDDLFKRKEKIMDLMKQKMILDLSLLDIHHNTITNESKLEKEKNFCWEKLEKMGLLEYTKNENGTKVYFKSKDFKDDKDRVIQREDGSITYFGSDIAYHWKKKVGLSLEECNNQIIVLGDDHIGYLNRLLGAVKNFNIDLKVVTHNLVKILKNGEEVKMSKRNGNFITIRDFITNYCNKDILCIAIMEQSNNSPIFIDINKLNLEHSPLFYIQYANARISSILKKKKLDMNNLDLSLLKNREENQLLSYLVYWPELIERIKKTLDVHSLYLYIRTFVQVLHSYFSNHLIINNNDVLLTNSRLFLISESQHLIHTILGILKIQPVDSM